MGVSRKTVVSLDEVGVYHCTSRCVRQAFLCGWDSYTGRNYEHRRDWVEARIQQLSGLFGIEILSYAVMSNHLHIVLRNRPDLVSGWSDREVGERWSKLFQRKASRMQGEPYDKAGFNILIKDSDRLAVCRDHLRDLSWFMRCLNESLARRANREDNRGGRFWEGRFKCQRLMDEGAILACMAYVDLNPVRACMADGLEDSHFTSIYDRLKSKRAKARLKELGDLETPTYAQKKEIELETKCRDRSSWLVDLDGEGSPFTGVGTDYYLSLVEWTGQHVRDDKPGYIPVQMEVILDRFDLDAKAWAKNVSSYGSLFHRIVGPVEELMEYARKKGQRWFCGRRGGSQLYAGKPRTA